MKSILTILFAGLIHANTLTFLFENEYNSTTSLAACRNNIDKVLETRYGFSNYFIIMGKSLGNMGDIESC